MKSFYGDIDIEMPVWMFALLEDVNENIRVELNEQSKDYQKLKKQQQRLIKQYACIQSFLYEEGEVRLDQEEHKSVLNYLQLSASVEAFERRGYYMYGHSHCYEYMKRIGALRDDERD